ncbi:MAG TPA: hypothetical protein VK880_03355, partial [Anaerolineales bacterium]|nr:hypothetical protein [Anaerolineales bacterium]
ENIRGFKGLFNDPVFLELYKYTKVSKGSEAGRGMALVAWLKKDFLQGLLTDPNFNVVVYEYTP